MTVLIADDDENDVFLLRRILRRLEMDDSVHVVNDGAEAIAYVAGSGKYSDREVYPAPSLLILDRTMPGLGGDEVIEWLKGKPELQNLFVVVLTGAIRPLPEGSVFKRYGNVVLLNSDILKPARMDTIESLVGLFRSWFNKRQSPIEN